MGVDTAEPERIHTGPPRDALRCLPCGGFVYRFESGARQCRMRLLAVQGRRQCPVVQRQDGLDEPGGAGRGHGMTDHGLHGTDSDRRSARGAAEHPSQGGQFRRVPDRGGGPVGLDETERTGRGRVQPGVGPGPLDGQDLPLLRRREQGGRPSVTGNTATADHSVDAVTGTFGVRQSLQYDHPDTLADQDAIGPPVERPDPRARGQRTQQREDAPECHFLGEMHATRDHGVRSAAHQLAHGRVKRDQGRRACRVQRVCRAMKVEPVGDARGSQVRHQADRGLRTVRTKGFDERGADRGELVGRQRGDEFPQRGDELGGDLDPLVQPGKTRGEVAAAPQYHPCPATIAECVGAPGVRDSLGCDPQRQQLIGLGPVHRQRHDPELDRVEGRELLHEAAAPTVDPIGGDHRFHPGAGFTTRCIGTGCTTTGCTGASRGIRMKELLIPAPR